MTTNEIPFHLREFSYPDDVVAARKLWADSAPGVNLGRSDTPEELVRKLARDPDLFLVAEVDGRLVGTVIGGFDGRRGLVYHLAVAQPYQSFGIGSALMQELELRLAQKGCHKAYLMVIPGNPSLLDFYARRGWNPMDITILAKELR